MFSKNGADLNKSYEIIESVLSMPVMSKASASLEPVFSKGSSSLEPVLYMASPSLEADMNVGHF